MNELRTGLSPFVTTGTETPMIFVPVMSMVISPFVATAAERTDTVPSTDFAIASEYCASDTVFCSVLDRRSVSSMTDMNSISSASRFCLSRSMPCWASEICCFALEQL